MNKQHGCILSKTDNEDVKTKMKEAFQLLSKEVHDRDRLTKEIELLKKENLNLKFEFNKERYSKYTY